MPKAKLELRVQDGQPTVSIRVPPGTSISDIAKIQASLFANPEKLGPEFVHAVGGCTRCTSGIHIILAEDRTLPAARDVESMFTHLTTELREISTRLSALERGGASSRSAEAAARPTEVAGGATAELEF